MAWWHQFFSWKAQTPLAGPEYEVDCQLYTEHGERGAEVRVRRDGQAYFIALEWVEGTTFRPVGDEIGPFASSQSAEAAAVNSPWFLNGG